MLLLVDIELLEDDLLGDVRNHGVDHRAHQAHLPLDDELARARLHEDHQAQAHLVALAHDVAAVARLDARRGGVALEAGELVGGDLILDELNHVAGKGIEDLGLARPADLLYLHRRAILGGRGHRGRRGRVGLARCSLLLQQTKRLGLLVRRLLRRLLLSRLGRRRLLGRLGRGRRLFGRSFGSKPSGLLLGGRARQLLLSRPGLAILLELLELRLLVRLGRARRIVGGSGSGSGSRCGGSVCGGLGCCSILGRLGSCGRLLGGSGGGGVFGSLSGSRLLGGLGCGGRLSGLG